MRAGAVLAPGYGGTAKQPILRALAARLEQGGIASRALTFSTRGRRPSGYYVAGGEVAGRSATAKRWLTTYESELADLRAARDLLRADHERVALVGRSFGGRMCALLAVLEPPDALAVLGHPISPPGRPRPDDEAALAAMLCPTLVVQGERDELGPLAILQRIAGGNPHIDLVVIAGAGHDFGAKEGEAIEATARWLEATLA